MNKTRYKRQNFIHYIYITLGNKQNLPMVVKNQDIDKKTFARERYFRFGTQHAEDLLGCHNSLSWTGSNLLVCTFKIMHLSVYSLYFNGCFLKWQDRKQEYKKRSKHKARRDDDEIPKIRNITTYSNKLNLPIQE